MGINFQRIRRSEKQQGDPYRDERSRQQQTGWRLGPILLVLIVLSIMLGFVYLYMFSSRHVFPAVVRAEEVSVTTPVSGTVTDLLSADEEAVRKGRIVAEIKPAPNPGSGPVSTRNDLRIRLVQARGEKQRAAEKLKQNVDLLPEALQVKKMNLWEQLERLEGERRQLKQNLVHHKQRLERRKKERKEADRLFRQDAATAVERNNVNERYRNAKHEVERVRSQLQGIKDRIHFIHGLLGVGEVSGQQEEETGARKSDRASRQQIDTSPSRGVLDRMKESRRREIRTTLRNARKRIEQLERSLKEQKRLIRGQTEPVTLKAPLEGEVLRNHIYKYDDVREGDELLRIFNRRSMFVRAYVHPEHASDFSPGKKVQVYVSGRKMSVTGQIDRVHNKLVKLPDRRDLRRLVDQDLLLPVDIRLPSSVLDKLVLNESCRLVVSSK